MKKKLIPTLALAALGAVGCGPTTSGETAQIFWYQYDDAYISTVRAALEADFDANKVAYTSYNGENDAQKQTVQITNAISSGSSGILLVNAVNQEGQGETVSREAKNANIPVVFFNREVTDAAVNSTNYPDAAFVGTDPDEAGYMQGEILFNALAKEENGTKKLSAFDRNGDGKINYVMLRGPVGNAEADGRTTYSVQEANRLLNEFFETTNESYFVQLGDDVDCNWDQAIAANQMANLIGTHTAAAIECVIANNDMMAVGAIQSLVSAGLNQPNGKQEVLVVGVDAVEAGKNAIDAKQMYGTVQQDGAEMARVLSVLARNKLAGKDYLDGLTGYEWDSETVHKIRIPYGAYTAK